MQITPGTIGLIIARFSYGSGIMRYTGRVRGIDGKIHLQSAEVAPVPPGSTNVMTVVVPMPVGEVLSARLEHIIGSNGCGASYGEFRLANSEDPFSPCQTTLMQGWPTAGQPLTYLSGASGGVSYAVFSPDGFLSLAPAAGSEWNQTWTSSLMHEFFGLMLQLTCSATVASRRPALAATWGFGNQIRWYSPVVATAGQTLTFVWSQNSLVGDAGNGFIYIPVPSLRLPLLGALSTVTDNLQAGDQWSPIDIGCTLAAVTQF